MKTVILYWGGTLMSFDLYIKSLIWILLIVWAIALCMIMPMYKTKSRLAIICLGVVVGISYFFLNPQGKIRWAIFDYFYFSGELSDYLWYGIDIFLSVIIFFYLFFVSLKVHSKLLNLVNVVLGILNVLVGILEMVVYVNQVAYHTVTWLYYLDLCLPIISLTILIILLVFIKYEKGYQVLNETQTRIQTTKICPNCGNPISENNKFCINCGTPLNNK